MHLTTTIPTRGTKGMKPAQVHNGANTATNVTACGVADITFVNDSEIRGVQMDKFESDSDDKEDVYLGSDDESEVSTRGVSSNQRDKIRVTRSSFCVFCVRYVSKLLVFLGS